MRLWDPSNEAFGMTGPGGLKGPPALLQHALGSIVMDVENGGDKLVHGSGGISQPRAE